MRAFVALGLLLWAGEALATAARMELYELESGRLLYLGAAQEKTQGSELLRSTRVCRPDGTRIMESELRLDAASQQQGHVRHLDLRHGIEKVLQMSAREVALGFRERLDSPLKTKTLARSAACFAPDAIPAFVRAHWAELLAGESRGLQLAIADAHRLLEFRASRESEDANVLVVRIEAESWVIRRLAGPMFFHFEKKPPHRLAEIRGPSNYVDEKRQRLDLRIVYTPTKDADLPCR